jgi:hypothetical protein
MHTSKLIVELDEEQKAQLREVAWQKRNTMAGIIRLALSAFFEEHLTPVGNRQHTPNAQEGVSNEA